MAKTEKENLLIEYGFTENVDEDGSLYYSFNSPMKAKVNAEEKGINYLKPKPISFYIDEWDLEKTDSGFVTNHFVCKLNLKHFINNFAAYLKEKMELKVALEVIPLDHGKIKFFIEIKNAFDASRQITLSDTDRSFYSQNTLVGFSLSFGIDKDQFLINLYDYFVIGKIASNFIIDLPSIVTSSLNISDLVEQYGLYEQRCKIDRLIRVALANSVNNQSVDTLSAFIFDNVYFEDHMKYHLSFFREEGWTIEVRDIFSELDQSANLPIEVLEERELRGSHLMIDYELLSRNYEVLEKIYDQDFNLSSDFLFLMRRVVAVSISGDMDLHPELINDMVSRAPNDILLLSLRLQLAVDNEEDAVLKLASKLGGAVSNDLGGLEQVRSLDLVFGELLADAWFLSDFEKSRSGYERVISRRGNIRRILQKLCKLCKFWQEESFEFENLMRLELVEDNNVEKSHIFLRLAQLSQELNMDDAIVFGKKALLYNPTATEVAKFSVNLLLDNSKPKEAIQLLADVSSNLDVTSQKNEVIAIEIQIGDIWSKYLNRLDIAKQRYKKALEMGGDSIENLEKLSGVFVDDNEALLHVYELELSIMVDQKDTQGLTSVLENFVNLAKVSATNTSSVNKIYKRLAYEGMLELSYVDLVIEFDERDICWDDIYQSLLKGLDREITGHDKALYHRILGDISWKKKQDEQNALLHYLELIRIEPIEDELLYFLVNSLEKKGDYIDLSEVLRISISFSEGEKKSNLLEKMLSLPIAISSKEADVFTLMLLKEKPTLLDHMNKRIEFYAMNMRWENIESLLSSLEKDGLDDSCVEGVLGQAISIVSNIASQESLVLLHELYLKLIRKVSDKIDVALRALEDLRGVSDKEILGPYLEVIIDSDRYVDLEEDLVAEVFAKNPVQILYYFEKHFFNHKDKDRIVYYGEKALGLLVSKVDDSAREGRILLKIAKYVPLVSVRLEKLFRLVQVTKQWEELLESLYCQIEMLDDKKLLLWIWRVVFNINDTRLGRQREAYASLCEIYNLVDYKTLVRFEVAEYSIKVESEAVIEKNMFDCLYDSETWIHKDNLKKILEWLIHNSNSIADIKLIAQDKIDEIAKVGKKELAADLVNLLEQYSIRGRRLCWNSLVYYVESRNNPGSFKAWFRLASMVKNKSELSRFIGETQTLFEKYKMDSLLVEIIQRGLIEESIPYDLEGWLVLELKLFLGVRLFEDGVENKFAYSILKEFYNDHPDNSKTWVPLYFLMRELGSSTELYQMLYEIIPKLKNDAEALKKFPVTLESLNEELKKLEEYAEFIFPVVRDKKAYVEENEIKRDESSSVSVDTDIFHVNNYKDSQFENDSKNLGADDQVDEWRDIVFKNIPSSGITERVMDKAFESDLEKHVALQTVGLISNELHVLNSWPYRVWRFPNEVGYNLSGTERIREDYSRNLKKSQLFQILMTIQPILADLTADRFSVNYLATRLKREPIDIINERRPVPWNDRFFEKTLFTYYVDYLNENHIVAFSLKGLGNNIFFDTKHRAIYFDAFHFKDQPITHLFHKVMLSLKAVKNNYFFILSLDSSRFVAPFLLECKEILTKQKFRDFKQIIGIGKNPIFAAFSKFNVDKVRLHRHFDKVKDFGESEIEKIKSEMNFHLYQQQLAETLDVIGLIESTTSCNLVDSDIINTIDLLKSNRDLSKILDLCLKLKL